MNEKDNNFALLRHLAALGVLFSHAFSFAGVMPDILIAFPRLANLPKYAVAMFFVMSGYLVSQSMSSSGNISRYFRARFLRIYPGFFACIVVCTLAGAYFTNLPVHDYFVSPETLAYVLRNLVFQNELGLPGVFLHNPEPRLISGNFWTLSLEVFLYALIPLVWWLGRRTSVLAALTLCALTMIAARWGAQINPFRANLILPVVPIYYMDFLLGALLFNTRKSYLARGAYAALLLLLATLIVPTMRHDLLREMVFAALVIFAGNLPALSTRLARILAKYDVSYGTYLYGVLVPQAIVIWVPHLNGWQLFAIALPPTVLVALASWCCVERPALALKRQKLAALTSAANAVAIKGNDGAG